MIKVQLTISISDGEWAIYKGPKRIASGHIEFFEDGAWKRRGYTMKYLLTSNLDIRSRILTNQGNLPITMIDYLIEFATK